MDSEEAGEPEVLKTASGGLGWGAWVDPRGPQAARTATIESALPGGGAGGLRAWYSCDASARESEDIGRRRLREGRRAPSHRDGRSHAAEVEWSGAPGGIPSANLA